MINDWGDIANVNFGSWLAAAMLIIAITTTTSLGFRKAQAINLSMVALPVP